MHHGEGFASVSSMVTSDRARVDKLDSPCAGHGIPKYTLSIPTRPPYNHPQPHSQPSPMNHVAPQPQVPNGHNQPTQTLFPDSQAADWFLDHAGNSPAFRRHPTASNNPRAPLRKVTWKWIAFDAFRHTHTYPGFLSHDRSVTGLGGWCSERACSRSDGSETTYVRPSLLLLPHPDLSAMPPTVTPNLDYFYPQIGMRVCDGRYEFLRYLGSGQHSTTWLVIDLKPPAREHVHKLKYYAVKILTRNATEKNRDGTRNELAIHRVIRKNIRSFDNVAKIRNDFEIEGPTGPHLCLVFEPMGPDVTAFRMTAPNKALRPYIVKKVILDIGSALQGLHANDIIHTNVKGDNILIDKHALDIIVEEDLETYTPEVLGEFEMSGKAHYVYAACPLAASCSWDISHYDSELLDHTLIGFGQGERLFNPVANGDGRTMEEDLLAQILAVTGQRFSSATLDQTQWKNRLLDGEGNLLRGKSLPPTSFEERLANYNHLPEKEAKGAAEFLRYCLQAEPSNRPTAKDVTHHEWLSGWLCCN